MALDTGPPTTTDVRTSGPSTSSTRSTTRPSSISTESPGWTSAGNPLWVVETRPWSPSMSSVVTVNLSPGPSMTGPSLNVLDFGCCRIELAGG